MGKIWSKAKKPIQNFNLERRLDKALDAPKNKKPLKRHIDPDSELYRKDDDLIKRVGKAGLFKTSIEPTTDGKPHSDAIPHLSRAQITEPEFGYHDVPAESIPKGKTTLPKLLEILTEVAPPTLSGTPPNVAGSRTADDIIKPGKSDFTLTKERAADIAKRYNLEPEQIISLAKRFKLFDLHIPSTRTNSVKRMQLLSEQLRLGNATTLQLDDNEEDSEDGKNEKSMKELETKKRDSAKLLK